MGVWVGAHIALEYTILLQPEDPGDDPQRSRVRFGESAESTLFATALDHCVWWAIIEPIHEEDS